MATYGNMIITTAGQALYAKVQSGTALTFTRLQIGGGELSTQLTTALVSGTAYTSLVVDALPVAVTSGDTIQIGSGSTTQSVTASAAAAIGATTISVNSFTANAAYAVGSNVIDYTYVVAMTALITPISYITINSIADNSGTAQVNALFQNTSLTASTYTCEIGLFAQDPTAGEILYAYANAGANGDTIPPYADGPFSRQFQINIAVGSATSVTANIPAGTYVLESAVGAANGVATLDANAKVPIAQLGNFLANTSPFTTNQTAPAWVASGLTGVAATSRYVGATASGAPTSGSFAVGDFVIDQTGVVWICTTAGTPGTWTSPYNRANTWTAAQTFNAQVRLTANGYFYFSGYVSGLPPSVGMALTNSSILGYSALFLNGTIFASTNPIYVGASTTSGSKVISLGDSSGTAASIDSSGKAIFAGTVTSEGNQLLQALSGGYKIQSGTAGTFSLTASSSLATSITFPVAFSNTAYATSFTIVLPSSGSAEGIEIWVNSRTTTSIGITIYSSTTQTISLDYTVIGS